MDAPELKSVLKPVAPKLASPHLRPRLVRAALVGLAIVLAVGLWQAYGVWLFSTAASHVL